MIVVKKNSVKIFFLLFFIVPCLFFIPFIGKLGSLGPKDWDQFASWNIVARNTLLYFHQFPLWNPYVNGGNVLLAHPHSSFLSPLFMCVLVYGPVIGMKVQMWVHFIIGLIGMHFLCRAYKSSVLGSYLGGLVYMGSSMYFLHMAEGHAEWMCMAFLPWFLFCYQKSLSMEKYKMGAILSISLMCFGGSVDILSIVLIFGSVYALLLAFSLRSWRPLFLFFYISLGGALICAVKVLPMIDFLLQFPRVIDRQDFISFPLLKDIFLNDNQWEYFHMAQHLLNREFGCIFGWHEYGAYIGYVPCVFLLGGICWYGKKYWPLTLVTLLMLCVALGNSFFSFLWRVIHSLPFYNNLVVHSRFLVGFLCGGCVFVAMLFSRFESILLRSQRRDIRIIPVIIVCIVGLDLLTTNSVLLYSVNRIPQFTVIPKASFTQQYRKCNVFSTYKSRSSQAVFIQANQGVLKGYEVVQIKQSSLLKVASDPDYRKEVYLKENRGRAEIVSFSPNRIEIQVDASNDILIINQNIHSGWKAFGNHKRIKIDNASGLMAIPIQGNKKIVLIYFPFLAVLGMGITFMSTIFFVRKWCHA